MRVRWRRLLTNPTTRVISRDGDLTLVKVDGLICDGVCAVRTKEALSRIEGVTDVRVDFDAGVATITGREVPGEEYERAVTGVVAGRRFRLLLEHLSRGLHRHDAERAS